MLSDISCGKDVSIVSEKPVVDDDALADLEPALSSEMAVGADAGGENDKVGWDFMTTFEQYAVYGFIASELFDLNASFDLHLLLFQVRK